MPENRKRLDEAHALMSKALDLLDQASELNAAPHLDAAINALPQTKSHASKATPSSSSNRIH
jgi:hypothetical protein